MLWRAPWLRRRIALMGVAAWDIGALYLSYNLSYIARLGEWEGWSSGLAVIVCTWLSVSYLAGRYSPNEVGNGESTILRLGQTLLPAFVVLVLFVLHSWIYQVVEAETRFRGFLLPMLGCSVALSDLGQLAIVKIRKRRKNWVIFGSARDYEVLRIELSREQRRLQSETTLSCSKEELVQTLINRQESSAIAVGHIDDKAGEVTEILLEMREGGVQIIPLLGWCEEHLQRIPPELISTAWLVEAEGFGLRPGSLNWRVKRLGDVLGAATLVIATCPLLALGGLLVWIEDRGPILYSQIRTGLFGRPIRIWKLRSMSVEAEKSGAQWATRGDSRITRAGRFLRATRIDELPQLFSVLNGDLSLIGPRPERPEIEEELERQIPHYRIRHWIRPGLSGWAQVCYPYGASVEDSRMKLSYDLYYLRNTSLLLDALITIKTIRLVAQAQGASPKDH